MLVSFKVHVTNNSNYTRKKPIPLTAQSKAYVCGRSPFEIVVSNPTGGRGVCLVWVLWVFRQKSLRRADHSSIGVLPTVACHCVWSRKLKNEEGMARVGPQRQKEIEYLYNKITSLLLWIYHIKVASEYMRKFCDTLCRDCYTLIGNMFFKIAIPFRWFSKTKLLLQFDKHQPCFFLLCYYFIFVSFFW